MGRADAFKNKILRKPTATDIKPEKMQSFLERFGFVLKRSNGSHFMYEYIDSQTGKHYPLVIPMHDPIKPAYIDQIRKIIIEVEGENDD